MTDFSATELLAPAGGRSQLEAAVRFGADAVYLAADKFGMRQRAVNFTLDDIPSAVAFAHGAGAKVYVTVNTLMSQADIAALPPYLEALDASGADALIVSDLGAFSLARRYAPHLELHVSTQASVMNAEAARTWYDLGASRVVVAREMSVEDIAELRAQAPRELEIEAFVHGAMCMAYSGRCMLSAAMTGRSGNKGFCAQPCRWSYALVEEKRPGAYYPIEEDVRGTYVMNAHDLCMIEHLDDLARAGVNSFKIEGRNKRAFYVATVVHAYRAVMDGADPASVMSDLHAISHRPYGTGFFYGKPSQRQERDGYDKDYLHAATVTACQQVGEGAWRIQATCHNRFCEGDELEILTPRKPIAAARVQGLTWLAKSQEGDVHPQPVPVANRTMETYAFESRIAMQLGDLLRIRIQQTAEEAVQA